MKTDNFELFRAIGNADDRFIDEMLDGRTESLIKEKNKRRYVKGRLAVRSIAAAAAAAAVVFAAADLGILGGSEDGGLHAERAEQNAVVLDTQTETEDAEITEENAETADKSDEMTEAAEEKEIKEEFSTAVDGLPEENETQEKDISENNTDSLMTGTVTTATSNSSDTDEDYPDTDGITEADIASADNLVQAAKYYGLDCESVVYSGGERSFTEEDFELLFGGDGAKSRSVSPEGSALETLTTEEFILLECTLDREDAPDEFTMKIYSTGLVCTYFDGEEFYFMFSPYGGKRVYDILLGE
ncbi:MAG: hypothetical protein ACI4JW_04030 [Oscillospiraceae bacterium]